MHVCMFVCSRAHSTKYGCRSVEMLVAVEVVDVADSFMPPTFAADKDSRFVKLLTATAVEVLESITSGEKAALQLQLSTLTAEEVCVRVRVCACVCMHA